MKAEDQSMLIADAAGQQTVQAVFIQTGPKRYPRIGNVDFEIDPDTGALATVYSGTFEGYLQFARLMKQHACYPAHELAEKVADVPADEDAAEEPVVQTDPGKTEEDTLSAPAEIVPEGAEDAVSSAESASEGQPSPDNGSADNGSGAEHNPVSGPEPAKPAGRGKGRKADAGGSQNPESTGNVAATDKDPFADL